MTNLASGFIPTLLTCGLAACSLAADASGTCPTPPAATPGGGWPTDAAGLVAHLDAWDRDELEVVARPELHPNRSPSGETNGWVLEHQKQIRAAGGEVRWNAQARCFVLVPR